MSDFLQLKIIMLNKRNMLIGFSLLAVTGVGIYCSKNAALNGLLDSVGAPVASSTGAKSQNAPITGCPFKTVQAPAHFPVIIGDIAWMGNSSSSKNEWIGLTNISSTTAGMGGWELVNADEKIRVFFRSGAKILPKGSYILEHGSMDFLPGIKAGTFFTGSLKNAGDSFRLFDKDCRLIDQILTDSGWPAGDNATRRPMERDPETLTWHTAH